MRKTNPSLTSNKINQTLIDHGSTTCNEVIRYLEAEIDLLRKKNDGPMEELETAALRGRIKENSVLLAKLRPNTKISTDKMIQRG